MAKRRPMRALENEVMAYLWASGGSATPAEVHQAVAPDLAYTTVMTVMTRLWDKDLLTRKQQGRGFAYTPVQSEAEHRADEMANTLARSGDRDAVLSSFVASLDAHEATLLRELLAGDDS